MSKAYHSASSHDQGGHGEPWLLTYADMVTLLMALFIVLLSVSTVDQQKAEEMTQAVKKSVSQTSAKMTFQEIKEKVDKVVKENNLENQVTATLTSRGIDLEYSSQVFFDAGRADLKPEALKMLDATAKIIKAVKLQDVKVNVEGHTDGRPINTPQFPSNWELSTARASRVLRFMIEKGVDEKKLEAMGLAATRPKVGKDGKEISSDDPANRRVVIRVIRDPYAAQAAKAQAEARSKAESQAPEGAGH